ncbi:Moulting cycle family protein [Acanthocheilonema viteae]
MPGAQYYDGKKLNIPISKEAGIQLIERWIHQGISSIMACIATQHLNKLNEYERNRLQKCSKNSEDIYEQARCLVRAIDAKPKQTDPTRKFNDTSFPRTVSHLQKLQKLLNEKRKNTVGALIQSESHEIDVKRNKERKRVEFRTRRSVVNRHNYKLHTEYENLTPFGILGKYLAKMTRVIKNKDPNLSWKKMMHDIESIKRRENEKNDFAEQLQKRFSLNRYGRPKLTPDEKRLAKELHVSDHLLQGLDKNDVKTREALEFSQLFQQAIKLAMVVTGANGTELENKTLRFGSPRLLSMVPDDANDQISILSPSLFSMHDKGKGLEALTSIPALLKIAGNRDYDEWLNFIMEASGTTDAVHKLKESQESDWLPPGYKSMPRGIDGQPMYFTKENLTEIDPEMARKMEVFENLTRSLTSKQLMDFNTTGFSMLTPKQLIMLYGPQSPLNNSKALDFFMSLSEDDMHRHLINDIRDMAKMHSSLKIRRKRQTILSPSAFVDSIFTPLTSPFILSPAAFSLVLFSPSYFGTAVLSPAVFLPTLLSPLLLSPAVLSPSALSPIILSPLVISPGILSPGAIAPSILSPSILSPSIASPSVLSPAIMSPFVLNPSILSPAALTALVASPFAFSPSFFSPAYITAVIFSPNAFSPLFNSTGKAVTLLFSPSVGS